MANPPFPPALLILAVLTITQLTIKIETNKNKSTVVELIAEVRRMVLPV